MIQRNSYVLMLLILCTLSVRHDSLVSAVVTSCYQGIGSLAIIKNCDVSTGNDFCAVNDKLKFLFRL